MIYKKSRTSINTKGPYLLKEVAHLCDLELMSDGGVAGSILTLEMQILSIFSHNAAAVLGTKNSLEQRMTSFLKNNEIRIKDSFKTWVVTDNAIMRSTKPHPQTQPIPSLHIPWAVCPWRSKHGPDSTRTRQTGCTVEACGRAHHARRKESLDQSQT